jgi:hypothetical protein
VLAGALKLCWDSCGRRVLLGTGCADKRLGCVAAYRRIVSLVRVAAVAAPCAGCGAVSAFAVASMDHQHVYCLHGLKIFIERGCICHSVLLILLLMHGWGGFGWMRRQGFWCKGLPGMVATFGFNLRAGMQLACWARGARR